LEQASHQVQVLLTGLFLSATKLMAGVVEESSHQRPGEPV
jgi:hypothetical protein